MLAALSMHAHTKLYLITIFNQFLDSSQSLFIQFILSHH